MNKKEKIYITALKLFVEYGEQATSMKLIAHEADCGIGTMYNYFESKEILMTELFLKAKSDLLQTVFSDFDFSVSVKQQFNTAWIRTIYFYQNNLLYLKYTSMYAHKCNIDEFAKDYSTGFEQSVMQIYEKGKEEGIIKNEDTYMLLAFNVGAITNNILLLPNMNKEQIESIVKMAWDAIKS